MIPLGDSITYGDKSPGGYRVGLWQKFVAGGYRVYLEVAAHALSAFVPPADGFAGVVVRGPASPQQLALLRSRVGRRGRVITLDERGKWPHIRSNWVTRKGEVLQVSNRSAQPWIESNAALIRIIDSTPQRPPAPASAGGSSIENPPSRLVLRGVAVMNSRRRATMARGSNTAANSARGIPTSLWASSQITRSNTAPQACCAAATTGAEW